MSGLEAFHDSTVQLQPVFLGRGREIEWLLNRYQDRGAATVITGIAGVGKTALLRMFFGLVKTSIPPIVWSAFGGVSDARSYIFERIDDLYRHANVPEIVAIDDAEVFGDWDLNEISSRILNLKRVRMLIFVSRQLPSSTNAEILHLQPLSASDTFELIRSLLGNAISESEITEFVNAAGGIPFAIKLLANQVLGKKSHEVRQILNGLIYSLKHRVIGSERRIIAEVRPKIIMTNDFLIERLRQQPQSIYQLPSRKFEELIAELLTDLGYEVELTPATRDGGKDILAYLTTPHGRLLCLVEAKRYRKDRTVGVELVRELYGTLTDAEANSAMLVTTSSFSPDAHSFQKRHRYRIALRDYGNVVDWIDGYRRH